MLRRVLRVGGVRRVVRGVRMRLFAPGVMMAVVMMAVRPVLVLVAVMALAVVHVLGRARVGGGGRAATRRGACGAGAARRVRGHADVPFVVEARISTSYFRPRQGQR